MRKTNRGSLSKRKTNPDMEKGEMITLRCKCGETKLWTSDGTWDCQGCEKCQTTFAARPEDHEPLKPHIYKIKYHQNTGKPYGMCEQCGHIDHDEYSKAGKKDNETLEKEKVK